MSCFVRLTRYVVLLTILLSLVGCGEKTVIGTDASKLEASQNCIDCHEATVSPVTGKSVAAEWKLSAHNLNNKAGCIDCHFESLNHSLWHPDCTKCHGGTSPAGTKGLPPYAIKDPDSYGSCAKCHTSVGGFRVTVYNGIENNTLTSHFSTPTLAAYTSGTYKARYVTKNYEKKCRSCHNPHDTTSQISILRQWARSGKGNVSALPWSDRNFRTSGTTVPGATPATSFGTDCVRCHTATGHINFLADKSIAPVGGASKTEGKEVLACNVCHRDYSYARRPVGAVTAYYNKSTVSKMRIRIAVTYPNLGESNICLNCHVGREVGGIIKELADNTKTSNKVITPVGTYNFKNASFENSHYLTAGATIFKTSGFEFYSSQYSSQYYGNPSYYAHDKVGVSDYKSTGMSGPCITCHMKPGNHSFMPVTKDSNGVVTSLVSTTCNNVSCHNGSMKASELEDQKEQFNAAMAALKAMIQEKLNIYFYNASPYFYTKPYVVGYKEVGTCTDNLGVKNWQTGGTTTFTYSSNSCRSASTVVGIDGTGPNNMGAAFNYNLLYHDFGAFAHNRIYAKRLIYDSISWLYDNNVKATSNSDGYYSDVEAAIQTSQLLTPVQKTAAGTYLFTSRTYTTYIAKDARNYRPGSSSSSPVY